MLCQDTKHKMCWSIFIYLPTAYVVRWEGNVFTRVCPSIIHPSIHLFLHRWGTPARSSRGVPHLARRYPCQVQSGGGDPGQRGTCPKYPPARSGWEVPQPGGHPPRVPPPARSGWGDPSQGTPTQGTPWPGQDGGYPSQGVPAWDTPLAGLPPL